MLTYQLEALALALRARATVEAEQHQLLKSLKPQQRNGETNLWCLRRRLGGQLVAWGWKLQGDPLPSTSET